MKPCLWYSSLFATLILCSCGKKCEKGGFSELRFDLPVTIGSVNDTFKASAQFLLKTVLKPIYKIRTQSK